MNRVKVYLLGVVCVLANLCSPARATTLSPGQTASGTISGAAQFYAYTFVASAGDVLNLTMTTTSGTLSPKMQLYSPIGTLLATSYPQYPDGTCTGGLTVEMNTVKLSTAGTYTVDVSDCSAANTGGYDLYMQLIDNPGGPVSLSFGETTAGTISLAAQSNTFTFSANANDVVDLTATTTSSTSGTYSPKIRLYNQSTGSLVSTAAPTYPDGTCTAGSTIEMNPVTIPATGAYTVLIGDCSDTNAGTYELYAQRTDNPGAPVGLLMNQTQAGTISLPAQSNTYTFSASANDVIDLTMTATSGTLSPKIRIYNDSNGALLGTAYPSYPDGACTGGLTIELNTVTLPATGTYTVLVGDCGDTNTGSYELYSQLVTNPTGALNLPFGQTQTALIGSAAQSITYTFSANANDVFDFTLASTSGTLSPKIRLYNQTGRTLVDSAYPSYPDGACTGGLTIEMNTVTLPSTGKYTVLVGDCGDTNTGNFSIYGQRTNNPSSPTDLLWEQPQSGTISSPAQSNTFTFAGSSGNTIDLTLTATSGTLSPKIRLYNPDGSLNSTAYPQYPDGACTGGTSISMSSVSLAQNGTYTLLFGDCSDTNSGTYNISSQCFGTCPLPAPTLTSISPTNVLAGSGPITLTGNGTNFVSVEANSVVQWNGTALNTTWVSTTQMTAAVPGTDTATAGIFPVTVFTPAPGGGTSNAINFTVNNPVPVTTSISPSSATVGTATFTLTVNGTNFVASSQVMWNGISLAIVSQTATQLQATVPASDCTVGGTDTVTVFNPTPGGGTSNSQTFTCNNPAPNTTSMSPTSAAALGAAFTLTVNGSNFVQSSVVNWNGAGLPTTYISGSELQAAVPATDIATPTAAQVTVFNPTPGGGTSSPPLSFSVEAEPSALLSPTPGSTFASPSVTFTWTKSYGATWNEIWLGSTGVGSKNVWSSGQQTGTSVTATGLPINGEAIYARLFTYNGTLKFTDYTFTAVTGSVLTSPSPGITFASPSITFTWTAATGANWNEIWLGSTGVGSKNVWSSGQRTGTSVTATGLPMNGETIYARLFTDFGGALGYFDYTYTAVTGSVLTSPAPGETFASSTITFTWTAAAGANWNEIWLGSTGVGSKNVWSSGQQTGTSVSATGLPSNGEKIYARLFSDFGGALGYFDYTYTAVTEAALTSPVPGSTLTSSSETFTWTSVRGAAWYEFWLGTTGVGSKDLHSTGQTSATSVTLNNLPTNGEKLYARIYTDLNGSFGYTDYTYTAVAESALTSPSPGSILAGPSETFTWAPLTGASWYELWLGSTGVGSKNLYVSGEQTGTSVTVGALPINGEPMNARLFSYFNGILSSVDYTYTAATGSALTTPAPGSTFTGSSVQFTWTAVSGASWNELWLGSTGVGSKDLYSSGQTTGTSVTANGLPTNGEIIYARLFTYFNGAFGYVDYTYTAQ